VPSDLKKFYHPCTLCQPCQRLDEDGNAFEQCLMDDFHMLAEQCQQHAHRKTYYKYDSKECHYGLCELNVLLESIFDPATGFINFQKLDSMVNNFNKIILAALQCNMDISFIGSGFDANAILF